MLWLIPPKEVNWTSGAFKWPARATMASPSAADLVPLEQLAAELRRVGVVAKIERNAFGPADVRIRRDPHLRIKGAARTAEAYRLTIGRDGIEIVCADDGGAYYGIQTLREMLRVEARAAALRACVITDWPDFKRRGVYLDCSRGKVPTLQTLKELSERLARWKINELQLYVENVFTFRRHPAIGKGFSPFTPQEILELQDHCRLHNIRLVGSLASFGHLEKVLSLPQYTHLAESPTRGKWGLMSLCPTKPAAVKFIGELYEEFVPLFDAVDFNACCDETMDLGEVRSAAAAKRIGKGRLYMNFLLELYRLCRLHGKRMNVWADIVLEYPELLGEFPKDVVMLNWDYDAHGSRIPRTREIARAGLPSVVCPGTNSWQSHGSRLTEAIGNVSNFAERGLRDGSEGLLNTDWGDFGHRNFLGVSLHSFAHGGAHGWNHRDVDDSSFTKTFCQHVFGDASGKLAKAIVALGNSYQLCAKGTVHNNHMYHALVEPLLAVGEAPGRGISALRPAGLEKVFEQLSEPSIWPAPAKGLPQFEKLAFNEFAVASEMECLACLRGLAALKLRAGHALPPAQFKNLAENMAAMSQRFQRAWLARNKPSRLEDNLAFFERARGEAVALSKGKKPNLKPVAMWI